MTRFISRKEATNKTFGRISRSDRVLLGADRETPWIRSLLEQCIPQGEVWLYHPAVQDGEKLDLTCLLLDDRYAEGLINVSRETLECCGYMNERLTQKRMYELILRLAENCSVIGIAVDEQMLVNAREESDEPDMLQAYLTDCYVVGKYSSYLQDMGCFETVIGMLVEQAKQSNEYNVCLEFLEDMIGHGRQFCWLEAGTAPVLIYYGVTYCYNVMNMMLMQLVDGLRQQGIGVVCYDEQAEDVQGLARYVGKRFRAIIGMQTYLMSVYMKESGRFLHDEILGPKFNIVLDHPVWLKKQLEHVPEDYYVLTHDANYQKYISRYYPKIMGNYLFPPAGIEQEGQVEFGERRYDLVFIGTYGDYRKKCEVMHQSVRRVRFIANRFLLCMRKETALTAEAAFDKTLKYYGIHLSEEEFANWFYEMRSVIQCVMYYYREKVIETLLKAGIQIDVWGNSWRESPLAAHSGLIIHDEVTSEESLTILRDARISLNVMAWHKGGFTERMANSMLAGALVLTDMTTYDENGFRDGQQCVMYSLRQLEQLPGMVQELLADTSMSKKIAQQGYLHARMYHTWNHRAEELIDILDEIEAESRR